MIYLFFVPFILQAILIFCDEVFFHLKRDLPRFERIGHPLDTSTVLVCFAFALVVPYSILALKVFIGMSLFSAIFVTKDEFVHKEHCPWKEQWLHACLFLNHPLLLGSLITLWMGSKGQINLFKGYETFISSFLVSQIVFVTVFFLYQVIYWNFLCKKKS